MWNTGNICKAIKDKLTCACDTEISDFFKNLLIDGANDCMNKILLYTITYLDPKDSTAYLFLKNLLHPYFFLWRFQEYACWFSIFPPFDTVQLFSALSVFCGLLSWLRLEVRYICNDPEVKLRYVTFNLNRCSMTVACYRVY